MKIAFCVKGEGIGSQLDDRFGRAEEFVIVDLDTGEVVSIKNEAKDEAGGAGGKAVRQLYKQGVGIAVGPEFGPKAMDALKAFEMKVFKQGDCKDVEEALASYKDGKLEEVLTSTVEEHRGMRKA